MKLDSLYGYVRTYDCVADGIVECSAECAVGWGI